MGDIASLERTLLSPRPLLHQLDLVGSCRPGPYHPKTSPSFYARYDSNPSPSHLPSVVANPTALASLPLTLPLGGARWSRNNNGTRTLTDSSGAEKRLQKGNKTVVQRRKVANKRVAVVESSVCSSSVSTAARADGNIRNLPSEDPQEPSFPALQVPAVDSRSEAPSNNDRSFSPPTQYTGMPSIRSKPGARPRKMDRRMLRQKRTNVSTQVHKACAYLEARTVADDCTSKDMDEVARMALRSSNYDWSRRVPGNPTEEGYYGMARCVGQQRGVHETGAYGCRQTPMGGVHSPQMLQHPHQGSYATQENCQGYLYSSAAISPELLMQRATLMGETGPAAEKLKQIAAQHQMKESSRYGEMDGYVDEYPGYPYRSTEIYPVGAQYPLSGTTPYPEAAYLLSSVVQYPGRIDPDAMDQEINSESGFGATIPLSHYPVSALPLANQIAQPDHGQTNDLDSTNQERLLYRDPKRPASLTNRQAINYGDQEAFQTLSANRVPAEYHATDDVMNTSDVTRRAMMEQYGRQLQTARMFASEFCKHGGDTSSAHLCHVTSVVPTAVEAPSSRSQRGSEELARRSVQLPPNSPFLSTPSAVVSYSTSMEVGLPTSSVERGRTLADPRWIGLPGHHPFAVVGGGGGEMSVLADINGNGEFPDLTGHSPGLDCGHSPMLTGKRKSQSSSGLVSPASGYHYAPESSAQSTLPKASFTDSAGVAQANERARYCAREIRGVPCDFSENPVWSSQGVQPQGTSGFDVNPAQWGKYYQPLPGNNTFSSSPYSLGSSTLFPKGAAAREEATHGAVPTGRGGGGGGGSPTMEFGNRWANPSASSDAERDLLHRPQPNGGHLASCQFSSSSNSSSSSSSSASSSSAAAAASTASSSTTPAAVPPPLPPTASSSSVTADFVGSGCEDDAELFSYVDDDSPVELNFIDDLLSATR